MQKIKNILQNFSIRFLFTKISHGLFILYNDYFLFNLKIKKWWAIQPKSDFQ